MAINHKPDASHPLLQAVVILFVWSTQKIMEYRECKQNVQTALS